MANDFRITLKSICLDNSDIQLLIEDSVADLKSLTGNIENIFILKKLPDGKWTEVDNYESVNESTSEFWYFVTKSCSFATWQDVRQLSFNVWVRTNAAAVDHHLVTEKHASLDLLLGRLSELESWRGCAMLVRVRAIWEYNDGRFMLEYDAKVDFREFLMREAEVSVRNCFIRHCFLRFVLFVVYAHAKKVECDNPFYYVFVVDGAADELKVIPLSAIDVDVELEDNGTAEENRVSYCLFYLGTAIQANISGNDNWKERWGKIRAEEEDVEQVFRDILKLLDLEADELSLSNLQDSVRMNCVTTFEDLLEDHNIISDSSEFTRYGLSSEQLVDDLSGRFHTERDNIFLLQEGRLLQNDIFAEYVEEMKLSYVVMESMAAYARVSMIWRGAFGTIYKYEDQRSNVFAFKEIQDIFDYDHIQQFIQEVRILKLLDHDNVVSFLGYFHENRTNAYIKMELMDTSLGAIVRDSGSGLVVGEVRHYTLHITEGLAYLHSQSIMHRDLKCDNVLVKEDNVKLCDFGLSKVLPRHEMQMPRCHSFVGTVHAMPPEMIAEEPYDASIDIWSLGAAVWEMASGRNCFSGIGIPRTILTIYKTKALEHNPNIMAEIQTFIDLCARSNPHERPTAAQLLTDPFLQTP